MICIKRECGAWRSLTTALSWLQGKNIIAYAGYCHVDQDSRPISGVVNLCPDLLAAPDFDMAKAKKVRSGALLTRKNLTL